MFVALAARIAVGTDSVVIPAVPWHPPDAKSDFHYLDDSEYSGLKRYWVLIAKRGNRYEYLTSTDGKNFQSRGEVEWGDGSPKHIGILAKNGGNKDASELDANFEFFELRASALERTSDGAAKR